MADENIVTNIVANADFSGLIADVNKVAASLSKLQAQIIQSDARLASQIATMNRSFGENIRRTGQFSTHFVTLTSDVEKFGKNLDGGKLKLRDYFKTFQDHTRTSGGLIRELAKQQVALQNAVIQPLGKNAQGLMQYNVHIPQGLDAVKNKSALARQELQIMNKVIQDGGVQLINWGKNTQWAGRQLTVGLTVPLAAFGKAAADAFRLADAELTRLTKVYGGIAATSAADLTKIRNEVSATAKDISKSYGVSFKDTITLAADIAATGKQGNELLGSIQETSRLAVLGEVDRQDAMKATLAIQNAFKQNTDQLSESINFLNAVENQTSTSLADLIEAIPKAGPVIQGMGGSVKDLALYLTAMKEGGINASEGANALKSALASLINPTNVAAEKFASMGIDLGGIVTKNAGNLTATILELQQALDQLDPLQKQQAIEQLFGKFQFARMNALFANLGKQGSQTLQVLDLMKASSQDLANVAGRELSMVTESASGKYRRALEGLKADLAGMGEEFLKVQTFFINVTDSIVNFVNKLPAPIKTILTFVTGLTAIIGPVIMLTGVLANFFGYIIKGASHFKSLFKGGEGWKMLTPEILAAQKAGSLVEQTFYSDAKAATVLKTAIAGLITEFEILQTKAASGAISVAPALSTMAGNIVTTGSGRVVDASHPLISPEDTRSMSHLNPVAGMTSDQKARQTIFGVVPGAPKVNQKIGNNPQMYMSGDLPKIPGLTSIGGASTGIVAEEAAKWHAMTGALAMQSSTEIELLKKEVATTGLITSELSDSYQALLPTMTKLVKNAAAESAAIVAELQAGKITVDQARSKIVQLNAQVESMIAQASVDVAGQQGRTIGLTTVPLLNQPVVNAAGKSNMKELARPGRTRDLLNKIARNLGVKTFGAGYSTETTIPKRFATGGTVYLAGGDEVFAPMGTDTVPAMLTPGEYVVTRRATQANKPLLDAINSGATMPAIIEDAISKYPNIIKDSQFEGAHASLSSPVTGSELSSQTQLSGRPQALANAFPNEKIFEVKDSNVLQLYKELNQAMKEGGAGVTQAQLLRGIKNSMRMGKLFESLPTTNNKVRRTVYKEMLKAIKTHKGKIFDADFAKIYTSAIKSSVEKLGPADSIILQKAVELSSKPSDIRINSKEFKSLAKNAGYPLEEMSAQQAMESTLPGESKFYKSEKSKSGKGGKTAVAIRTTDGWATQVRSGDTVANTKALTGPQKNSIMKNLAIKISSAISSGRRGHSVVTPDERSIALTNKWRRGYASGGMVTPTQYLANPAGIVKSAAQMAKQEGFVGQRALASAKSGGLSSPMAGVGIGMGMQAAGGMMGGQLGTILQVASILPMISMTPIVKLTKAIAGMGGAVKTAGGAVKIFELVLKNAFRVGPILLVTAAVTGLIKVFKMWRKETAENAKEQTMLNGITKKGASEAGIRYNNLSDSIKGVKDQLELAKAANENAFNSQNWSGVSGLTLTIKELQDRIKSVKTEMPEFVSTLNGLSRSQEDNKKATVDMAANWKAQFVSSGMSVENATNQIYAIIKASNMANHAFAAISSQGFRSIEDRGAAVAYMFKELDKNMTNLTGEDLGNALSNVVLGIESARQALVGTKDANGEIITQQKALEITMTKLNEGTNTNTKLSQDQINSLKKTHPELEKILNTTDSIKSVSAKWALLLAGIPADLKNITGAEAEALAQFSQLQDAAISVAQKSQEGQDGYISSIAKSSNAISKLNKQILAGGKDAERVASKTKDQINAEIKLIDKRIKKIQEEADARIKAIQKTQNAESYAVELKQAQLDVQSAIASGDKEAQARATLALSALQKRHESEMAIYAIEEDAAAKSKIEENKKIKLQEELDRIGKNLVAAQTRASDVTITRDQVAGFEARRENLLKQKSINDARGAKDPKKAIEDVKISQSLSVLANEVAKSATGKDKALAAALKDAFGGILIDAKTGASLGGKVTQSYEGSSLSSSYVKGAADIALQSDAKSLSLAMKPTEGLLEQIRDILGGKGTFGFKTKDTAKDISFDSRFGGNTNKGGLETWAKERIITENNLQPGQFFKYSGQTYKVGPKLSAIRQKALGGPFAAGQIIQVNDRINPLGAQQEGMLIKPDFSGIIYPNSATMPKYDIPSKGYKGYGSSGSFNSSSGPAPIVNNYITPAPGMDIYSLAREVGKVTAKAVSRSGNSRGYSNGSTQVLNI